MAIATISATRRRNVKPVTSIIRANLVRDIDCSAMEFPPEDGQIIICSDGIGSNPPTGPNTEFFAASAAAWTALGAAAATDAEASQLRMVWGSAQHTDRQSTGDRCVPTIWGPIEVETNLYQVPVDTDALNANTNYPVGRLVSVIFNTDTVEGAGANKRLILTPLLPDAAAVGWVVGVVTRSSDSDGASGVYLRVLLYEAPRFVGTRV